MNILVVNDDGIEAAGLRNLVTALSKVADVYVCAPNGQRSAKSHAITIGQPVMVEDVSVPDAKKAYATDGTPADCTKLGLQFFEDQDIEIDMVFSGINMGSNLGLDTLYSGTVGAAMEAAMSGYHAVAVSVDSHEATNFDAACKLAVEVISKIHKKMPTSMVININTPDLPENEIKGVKFTRLGDRYYNDRFRPDKEGRYILDGQPTDYTSHPKEFDVAATAQGYSTITPIHFDRTDYQWLEKIKDWSKTI